MRFIGLMELLGFWVYGWLPLLTPLASVGKKKRRVLGGGGGGGGEGVSGEGGRGRGAQAREDSESA